MSMVFPYTWFCNLGLPKAQLWWAFSFTKWGSSPMQRGRYWRRWPWLMIGAGINDKLHEPCSKLANSQKKHCCQINWNDRAREIPDMLAGMLDLSAILWDFFLWKAWANGFLPHTCKVTGSTELCASWCLLLDLLSVFPGQKDTCCF